MEACRSFLLWEGKLFILNSYFCIFAPSYYRIGPFFPRYVLRTAKGQHNRRATHSNAGHAHTHTALDTQKIKLSQMAQAGGGPPRALLALVRAASEGEVPETLAASLARFTMDEEEGGGEGGVPEGDASEKEKPAATEKALQPVLGLVNLIP